MREQEEKLFKKSDTPLERTVTIIVLIGFCHRAGWVAWILIWPFISLGLFTSGGFLAGILKMLL